MTLVAHPPPAGVARPHDTLDLFTDEVVIQGSDAAVRHLLLVEGGDMVPVDMWFRTNAGVSSHGILRLTVDQIPGLSLWLHSTSATATALPTRDGIVIRKPAPQAGSGGDAEQDALYIRFRSSTTLDVLERAAWRPGLPQSPPVRQAPYVDATPSTLRETWRDASPYRGGAAAPLPADRPRIPISPPPSPESPVHVGNGGGRYFDPLAAPGATFVDTLGANGSATASAGGFDYDSPVRAGGGRIVRHTGSPVIDAVQPLGVAGAAHAPSLAVGEHGGVLGVSPQRLFADVTHQQSFKAYEDALARYWYERGAMDSVNGVGEGHHIADERSQMWARELPQPQGVREPSGSVLQQAPAPAASPWLVQMADQRRAAAAPPRDVVREVTFDDEDVPGAARIAARHHSPARTPTASAPAGGLLTPPVSPASQIHFQRLNAASIASPGHDTTHAALRGSTPTRSTTAFRSSLSPVGAGAAGGSATHSRYVRYDRHERDRDRGGGDVRVPMPVQPLRLGTTKSAPSAHMLVKHALPPPAPREREQDGSRGRHSSRPRRSSRSRSRTRHRSSSGHRHHRHGAATRSASLLAPRASFRTSSGASSGLGVLHKQPPQPAPGPVRYVSSPQLRRASSPPLRGILKQ